MNIITALKKQAEKGNTMILVNGAMVSEENLRKGLLDAYMYHLKNGVISPDTPFTEYYADQKKKCLTVKDLISFITQEPESAAEEEVDQADAPEEVNQADASEETKPEAVEEPEAAEEAEETPKKAPRRRTAKK